MAHDIVNPGVRSDGKPPPPLAKSVLAFGLLGLIAGCIGAFLPVQHASWLGFRIFGVAPETGLVLGLGLFAAASVVRSRIDWLDLIWFLAAGLAAWTAYFSRSDNLFGVLPGPMGEILWLVVGAFAPMIVVLSLRFALSVSQPARLLALVIAAAAIAVLVNVQRLLDLPSGNIIVYSSAPDGRELGMEIRSVHSDWNIVVMGAWLCAIVFVTVGLAFGPWLQRRWRA